MINNWEVKVIKEILKQEEQESKMLIHCSQENKIIILNYILKTQKVLKIIVPLIKNY